jgi:asparaginyl-tRNA synthetase
MKKLFIHDLIVASPSKKLVLCCWLKSRREQKGRIFLDVVDSSGEIQAVFEKDSLTADTIKLAKSVHIEAAVELTGKIVRTSAGKSEIAAETIRVVGTVDKHQMLRPRSELPGWPNPTPKQINCQLSLRHLYLRNPVIMASLRFRNQFEIALRRWFDENNFVSFAAPLLTPCPLYEDETAVKLHLQSQDIFLTQCAGFYLEAAAHAFEKVYNIGPSFRAAESKSPRHLVEYWHVKAELAWGNLDDMMKICEELLLHVSGEMKKAINTTSKITQTKPCLDALKTPYARVSYKDAIEELQKAGRKISFGEAINGEDQTKLAMNFDRPFWIVGNPRSIEPFPYVIDPADPRLMRTADLIATGEGGELLGTAEKISDIQHLDERMKEKGRGNDGRYQFVREIHMLGCVPHIAFGMGFERVIRWFLGLPHVRDAIAFPRLVGRRFYP